MTTRDYEAHELAYENAVAHRYNRDYHSYPLMQRADSDFTDYVIAHQRGGDHILDLGCGPASMWPYWNDRLPAQTKLVGLDLSSGMIREAHKHYPDERFLVGNSLRLPFASGSFDTVIASSTLHHIPDTLLPGALAEIRRILGEEGRLIGREPLMTHRLGDTSAGMANILMCFRHMAYHLDGAREFPEPEVGDHHHAYELEAFTQFLQEAGLLLADIAFKHPFSAYIARVSHPLAVQLALLLDDRLSADLIGNEIFFTVQKHDNDAHRDIINRLAAAGQIGNEVEFLAWLQAAAEKLEDTHPGEYSTAALREDVADAARSAAGNTEINHDQP